jgi:hypothetical protein
MRDPVRNEDIQDSSIQVHFLYPFYLPVQVLVQRLATEMSSTSYSTIPSYRRLRCTEYNYNAVPIAHNYCLVVVLYSTGTVIQPSEISVNAVQYNVQLVLVLYKYCAKFPIPKASRRLRQKANLAAFVGRLNDLSAVD